MISAAKLAWLDSRLAIHNAHNYADFAMDVAESVYSGELPRARFNPLARGSEIESPQKKIDEILYFLEKSD